ncbi:expressed conserved protein [Echinococcus multilocularis]|uniref:Expressed conserved protein n=1 Tax=Echinococcus multilocularis TaxID=6211 RepID=A0A068YJZ8_ECHMU|nr:expressed conserved protein [Echinococcus multilocularis]
MLRTLRCLAETSWTIGSRRPTLLSLSQRRKGGTEQRRDQLLRESEALGVLAKNATVRVYLSPGLSKSLIKYFPSTEGEPVEVKSSLLREFLRKENITIKVIEDQETLPVLQVGPILDTSGCATGSSLTSPRGKLLKLRTTIDDHMMDVKVRQTSELLAKGYEVTVSVRLPFKQMRHLTNSMLSEEQKLSIKKKLYESSAQRFMNAFKGCSSKPPKLIQINGNLLFFETVAPAECKVVQQVSTHND